MNSVKYCSVNSVNCVTPTHPTAHLRRCVNLCRRLYPAGKQSDWQSAQLHRVCRSVYTPHETKGRKNTRPQSRQVQQVQPSIIVEFDAVRQHRPPYNAPTGVLWSITPSLVVFLLFYSGGATALTVWCFGGRLMELHFSVLHKQGDLRFDLVRVRENTGRAVDLGGRFFFNWLHAHCEEPSTCRCQCRC